MASFFSFMWIINGWLTLFLRGLFSYQDDESLRRWKEQLLGAVDFESVGGIKVLLELDLQLSKFYVDFNFYC